MSTTNREKRKVAKKIARRKAYEKARNIAKGRKPSASKLKGQDGIDGADLYRQLKEKYKDAPEYQKKEHGFVKFMKNLFRGKQRGA